MQKKISQKTFANKSTISHLFKTTKSSLPGELASRKLFGKRVSMFFFFLLNKNNDLPQSSRFCTFQRFYLHLVFPSSNNWKTIHVRKHSYQPRGLLPKSVNAISLKNALNNDTYMEHIYHPSMLLLLYENANKWESATIIIDECTNNFWPFRMEPVEWRHCD